MTGAVAPLHEDAPAKINLALHVTGRRADGYHLLDSLVAFTAIGDRLSAEPAPALSLDIEGPMAKGLTAAGNLVMRAAEALRDHVARPGLGARLVLEKTLPVASGIGGGSADAAAALRLLDRLWSLARPHEELSRLAQSLGADVPVCLLGEPARMQGVGETVAPWRGLPALPLVLANPGIAVATADVFRRLERRDNSPLPEPPRAFASPADLAAYLARCRNDLEPAATCLRPVIAEVLQALAATPGCLLARMSGSGATCFGLYADAAAAERASARLARAYPRWWCCTTETGSSA